MSNVPRMSCASTGRCAGIFLSKTISSVQLGLTAISQKLFETALELFDREDPRGGRARVLLEVLQQSSR
jgi:hypothetical protein